MKIINLLPKSRQQEMHYESILHSLWVFFGLSLCSFALVFLVQIGAKIYLESEASSLVDQISQTKTLVSKNQGTDIKQQIQQKNNIISDYKTLWEAAPKWSNALKAFIPLPPSGLYITNLAMSSNDKTVVIQGHSPTRELVIQIYNNILNDTKDFHGIDYPLENLVIPVNVTFHFSFLMQDGLLK